MEIDRSITEDKKTRQIFRLYEDLKYLMALVGTIKFFEKHTRIALLTEPAYSTKKDDIQTFYNYRDRVLSSYLENPRENHIVPKHVLELCKNIILLHTGQNRMLGAKTTIDKMYKVIIDILFNLISNYEKFPTLVSEFRRNNNNNMSERDTSKYISNAIEMAIDVFHKQPFHLIYEIEYHYYHYVPSLQYDFFYAMIEYLSDYRHRYYPEYYCKNIKIIHFICKSFNEERIRGIDIDSYNNFANIIKYFINNQLTDENSTITLNEEGMFTNPSLLSPLGKPYISKNFLDCAFRISEYDDNNLFRSRDSTPSPGPLNLGDMSLDKTVSPEITKPTMKIILIDEKDNRAEMHVYEDTTIQKIKEEFKTVMAPAFPDKYLHLLNCPLENIEFYLPFFGFMDSTKQIWEYEEGLKIANIKVKCKKSSTIKIKITDYSNSRNSLVGVDSEMEVNLDDTVQKVKEDYKKLGESTNAMKHYPLTYIKFSSNNGDELKSGKKVRDYKELLQRDNNIYIPRNDLGLHDDSLSKKNGGKKITRKRKK